MAASVVSTGLIHESIPPFVPGGCRQITPQGGSPASFEVFSMAKTKKPTFYSSKLTSAENKAVNGIIKKSWKNGRKAGFRAAFASMRSKGRGSS